MQRRLATLFVLLLSLINIGVVKAATSAQIVDNAADVGYYTALDVDSNGNAVIAYYDRSNSSLKIAFCNDKACSSPTTKTLVAGVGGQGTFTSMKLDASNQPVISYYTFPVETLHLLRCTDPACNGFSDVTVDSGGVGSYTSLALAGNNPVISYYDGGNGELKVAICTNADCSASNIHSLTASASDVGMFSSLQLDSSGFPVISYYDATADSVRLLRCTAANCSVITDFLVDASSHVGFNGISLQLNAAGYPLMSYYDLTNQRLKLAHCIDVSCSGSPTVRVVDDAANVGQYSSMKLDGSLPVISYYDETNGDLKLARCADANCVSATISVVDSTGDVGWDTSLQLGSAYISYYDVTNSALKMAFVPDVSTAAAQASPRSPQALPATGFAPGGMAALPPQRAEYASTAIGLAIPALDVQTTVVGVPLVDGQWDVSWLGDQAGHLQGTTWPTWVGNSVLTGHVWDSDNTPGVFAELHNLKYGDRVEIRADGRTYVYEVRSSQLVSQKNLNILKRNDGYAWLTLLTCEGFDPGTGNYNYRRAVSAVLVEIQ